MKRAVLLLALFLLGVFYAAAQDQDESYYAKSVPIVKILSHRDGFKVIYLKSSMEMDSFYVPRAWLKAGGKGEIIFGTGPSYPFFTVFWRDGEFDFIRLNVDKNTSALTWGTLRYQDVNPAVFDIETLELEF
jgi:hypothetical protein